MDFSVSSIPNLDSKLSSSTLCPPESAYIMPPSTLEELMLNEVEEVELRITVYYNFDTLKRFLIPYLASSPSPLSDFSLL